MAAPSRFNIRVYGILIKENCLLVNEEWFADRLVTKFPGGGLELGESISDCLAREWQEELNLTLTEQHHFYTTDFFQASAFDNSQVISIYYRVAVAHIPEVLCNTQATERSFWLPLSSLQETTFTLPIDQVVGRMLKEAFLQNNL